jgi:hypothetical protein
MQRVRPEKIGCGAASLLVGSTGLALLAGLVIPGMTVIAWVLLLASNLFLWVGFLAYIQGQKEDLEESIRILHETLRREEEKESGKGTS